MGGGLRRARFPRTVAAWRTIHVDQNTNSMKCVRINGPLTPTCTRGRTVSLRRRR
jgi:hypothetical protein